MGKKNSRGEEIPERIFPIFRDEDELPADADLGNSIANALKASRLLVVVCSPNAVASTYVADEIDYFKRLGHSDRIIAMIIDGEPNVSWDTSKHKLGFSAEQECFPELLVQCISGTSYDDYVSAPISEIRELDGDEQQDVFNDFLSSNGISDEHFQVN